MPYVQRPFVKYVVYYMSGAGNPAIGRPYEVEIDCFAEDGSRAGILYFFPERAALPANQDTVNGIYLYFKLSRFADVMTMLKEEKPLYLSLETVSKSGYIGTGMEPVGEQEGV